MTSVTEHQLIPILQGTLSAEHRSKSETLLAEVDKLEGYCFSLLKITSDASLDLSVRQASAICLKNAVKRRWSAAVPIPEGVTGRPPVQPIPQSDKQQLMAHLHECVVRSPPLVQKQLLVCVKEVVSEGYPEPWSGLLSEMLQNVSSNEPERVYGALLMMRVVASRLEYTQDFKPAMQAFCEAVLPLLLQLLQRLMAEASPAPELAMMMKTILKIFWSCVVLDIPASLVQDEALCTGWLQAIMAVLKIQPPTDGLPDDPREREETPWWKLKKWAARLTKRLFERYGEPRLVLKTSKPSVAFSRLYCQGYNLQFLKCVLEVIDGVAKGAWVSRAVLMLLFEFLEAAVMPADTYRPLEPFLLDILVHVAFPIACFTAADEAEWSEDPMEVIRKNSASCYAINFDNLYDPRDGAVRLIHKVMDTKKTCAKFLDPFMEHVAGACRAFRAEHDAAPGSVSKAAAYRMDGAALVIGMLLDDVLATKGKYKQGLEPMVHHYLLPLFDSPYPFLRAKGCWLAGKFAENVAFTQPDGSKAKGCGEVFDRLFELNLRCMQDRELPVQVEAVNAFRDFIEALTEAGRLEEKIKPILKDLLRHFFHMTGIIEAMDVLMSLDSIVENIGDDIQPFAVEVCTELVQVYAKVVGEADEKDEDELLDASMHIVRPIVRLLDACAKLPDTLAQLEGLLVPLLDDCISRKADEVFEEVCEMLTYFTYFAKPISPRIWTFWPRLESVLLDWGIDFVENIILPLDNFIVHGRDVFLSSSAPNYRESLFGMARYCLGNPDFNQLEVAPAAKLLDIVLLNCRGAVDEWVGPYLDLALSQLGRAKEPAFATLLMNVVPAALHYNATLTLQLLEAGGKTGPVFQRWFQMLQDDNRFFRRMYDKKLSCIGLSALLPLHEAALPAGVQQALPQIFQTIVKLLKRLKEQEDAAEQAEESGDEGLAGSQQAEDGDDVSDEDVDPVDEDAEYLEMLSKRAARMARAQGAEGEDDSDAIIFDDWTDDEEVESALDDIDAFDWLVTTLNTVQQGAPERFQGLMASLDEGAKGALQEIVQFAHIRKAQKQHEAGA